MPTREELEALDVEAAHLRNSAASAMAFEALRKKGWREPSFGKGDGLQPCPPDCGVCHPELVWSKRKGKR